MTDAQNTTHLEPKKNSKPARLAVTESFLSGQSKVVKIVLGEPLSDNSVFTVTEPESKVSHAVGWEDPHFTKESPRKPLL